MINNNQTFMSEILTILGPLGEKFIVFNLLGFEAKTDFDHEIFKITTHSTRSSKNVFESILKTMVSLVSISQALENPSQQTTTFSVSLSPLWKALIGANT